MVMNTYGSLAFPVLIGSHHSEGTGEVFLYKLAFEVKALVAEYSRAALIFLMDPMDFNGCHVYIYICVCERARARACVSLCFYFSL